VSQKATDSGVTDASRPHDHTEGAEAPRVIYFVETEDSDDRFFVEKLTGHDLRFASALSEVEADAEILSVYIHFRITTEFLDAHPALRLISTRSTGYDHIDLAGCAERGIAVANVSSCDDQSTAEHTFMLMLAVARRLLEVQRANKKPFSRYQPLRSRDLQGKTLGVVGTGRVGLRVVHIALAFGMKVLACDPYRRSMMAEIFGVRYVGLDELLQQSDVISLHAPLTSETYHMLDREAFAKCRHGVILINTARGGLIDTDALNNALDAGIVAGAGLDVLEDERVMQREMHKLLSSRIIEDLHRAEAQGQTRIADPESAREVQSLLKNQRIITRPNVVFTPHVAFNSVEAVERINNITAANIRAFLCGQPVNLVTA
jgi:D-lactate dehydrogenase